MKVKINFLLNHTKILFILICIFFYSHVHANWTILQDKNGKKTFVDLENIKEDGKFVYWYQLTDFTKPQYLAGRVSYLSSTVYAKGDCVGLRTQFLKKDYFSRNMGKDFVLSVNAKSAGGAGAELFEKWIHPPKNTYGRLILDSLCKKK